jgi:hypothetical protein
MAERCVLSVLGSVQTDVLRKVIEKDEDDGFFARFLYVFPSVHPQKLRGAPLDIEPVRKALKRLRSLAFDQASTPRTLYLAEDCLESFDEFRIWAENNSRLKGAGLKGWIAKGPGTVLRLALTLELMKWAGKPGASEPEYVSADSFGSARLLWEDCLYEHAERAFGFEKSTPADQDARKLALYLADSGERIVNASSIRERRCVEGLSRSEPVKAAFARLVDAGVVFPNPKREGGAETGRGRTGRARMDYVVNPRLQPLIKMIGNPEPD